MNTIPKDQAAPTHLMVHRHMQRRFNEHRHKFDRHRAKGPAFAAALDEFEKKLFGTNGEDAQ